MEDIGGVVHACLEGTVDVGEAGGRGTEAHLAAEVVSAFYTEGTCTAVNASLDGYALADGEGVDAWGEGGNDAC